MKGKDVAKWLAAAGASIGAALGIYYLVKKKKKPPVVQPPEVPPPEDRSGVIAEAEPILNSAQDLKTLSTTLNDNRLYTLADAVESGVGKAVDDVNKATTSEEYSKSATVLESVSSDLIPFVDFVQRVKEILETEGKDAAIQYVVENIGRVVDTTGAVLQEFELPGGDVLKTMLESGVVEHIRGDKAAAWVIVYAPLRDVTKPYLYMNVYGPKYDDRLGKEVYLDSNAVSGTSVGPGTWDWYQVTKMDISASIDLTLDGFSKSFSPEIQIYIPTPGIVDRITMKQVELSVACAFVTPCEYATRGLEFPLPDEYTADEKVFGGLKFTLAVSTTGELILVPEAWSDPASTVWEWTDETKSEIVERQVTATQVERYEVIYRKFRRWKIRVTIPSQTLTFLATTGDIKMDETWYEVYSGGVELGVRAEYILTGEVWAVDSLKYLERVAPEEAKKFHVTVKVYDTQYRFVGEYPFPNATITLKFTDGRIFTAVTDDNGDAKLEGDVPVDVLIDYLEVKGHFWTQDLYFKGWQGTLFRSTGVNVITFNYYMSPEEENRLLNGNLVVRAYYDSRELTDAVAKVAGLSGYTPFSATLRAGTYTVECTYGSVTKSQTATVEVGKQTTVSFTFTAEEVPPPRMPYVGWVEVHSYIAGEEVSRPVFVGGYWLNTPCTQQLEYDQPSWNVEVRLRWVPGDYTSDEIKIVNVKAGQTTVVNFTR